MREEEAIWISHLTRQSFINSLWAMIVPDWANGIICIAVFQVNIQVFLFVLNYSFSSSRFSALRSIIRRLLNCRNEAHPASIGSLKNQVLALTRFISQTNPNALRTISSSSVSAFFSTCWHHRTTSMYYFNPYYNTHVRQSPLVAKQNKMDVVYHARLSFITYAHESFRSSYPLYKIMIQTW
jgi:hypothetical protein